MRTDNRHHGVEDRDRVRIVRIVERTAPDTLGPGRRVVIMVQGCELRCKGCLVPSTHARDGGETMEVSNLAEVILDGPSIDGITLTGGEPMLQPHALSHLIDLVRAEHPHLSTMSFTGYRIDWLMKHGSDRQRELLERLDLLIDGPYVKRLHRPLKWRASANQRVLLLTDRHRGELGADRPVPLELTVDQRLAASFVGVPPVPEFISRLTAAAVDGGSSERPATAGRRPRGVTGDVVSR